MIAFSLLMLLGLFFCECIRLLHGDAFTCPSTAYGSCSLVAGFGVRVISGAKSAALLMCEAMVVSITHLWFDFIISWTDRSVS